MSKHTKFDKYLAQTGSWFCAVTHDLSLAENIKITILDFPDWSWIYHDPDTEESTPHVHFMFRTNGTRSIKNISDKIGLEGNYIQIVKSEIGYRRYIMHLDDKEKHQYDVYDVHTNNHSLFRLAKDGNKGNSDIFKLYRDYCSLCSGIITPNDFIKEHYDSMEKLNFSQKIKTFQIINSEWGHYAHT